MSRPNLGLYLDRPPTEVPERALTACDNVRIERGRLTNRGIGWTKFLEQPLNGPVTLIDNFFLRQGAQILVFGTTKDLYRYDEATGGVFFLTPRYETGTISVNNGSPTVSGSGTAWLSSGLKAGDQIRVGQTGAVDPTLVWHTIASIDSNLQLTLTSGYTGVTAANQPYTGRLSFTGNEQDYWEAETFPKAQPSDTDLWFATNGRDPVVKWDGIADRVEEVDLDFRCRSLRRYKNMMIYANLVLPDGEARPYSIRNSAIAEPENVSTKEASEFIAEDTLAPINGLFTLGDQLIVYAARAIIQVQFVGPPLVFIRRTAVDGIGTLTGRLVADFGDFHEFVGADTSYRFDGVTVQEVGHQLWHEILRQQSPGRIELAFGHFDEERGVLMWAIPRTSDPILEQNHTALLEHYLEDIPADAPVPFTQQHFPATASGFFERLETLTFDEIVGTWQDQSFRWNDSFFEAAFPLNLFGDAAGNVFVFGNNDSFDGAPISSFVRFARRPAFDERTKGVITRIYPFAERMAGAGYELGVLLWATDQAAGDLTLATQLLYDLTHAGNRFVSPRQVARFYEVEFATNGAGHSWTLQGYSIDLIPIGER